MSKNMQNRFTFAFYDCYLGPLLLTWFDVNPGMESFFSSHTLLSMWLQIHAGIKVNTWQQRDPWQHFSIDNVDNILFVSLLTNGSRAEAPLSRARISTGCKVIVVDILAHVRTLRA